VLPKTVALTKTKEITVYAAGLYQAPLLQLLHAKYYGKRAVAYELGLFLSQRLALSTIDFDYIVPIPLHWTRKAWRGFN
jgi:predicted amidophosphoribosyltransferase